MRLRLAGGVKNLVAADGDDVNQRLPGKKEGRPGLARFEQVVDTVAVACLVPVALVGEHRAVENLLQLLDLFVGENILFGLAARAFVAVGNLGI